MENYNLTVKTLSKKIPKTYKKIINSGNSSLSIEIDGEETIWDLKLKIQRALENLNNDNEEVLAQGNQRIIYRGRLLNNEAKIKDVANLQQNGDVLHVVKSGGATRAGAGQNQDGSLRENLEAHAREELVNAKIRSLRCLIR